MHTFTTNWFQCYDLDLTNGLNCIIVRATDWAGNTTTLTTNFTLDYSSVTNAPTLQIDWPADGMLICGNAFTCRGSISDPTATLTGQITDTNGDVNQVSGVIERNGNFWLENLPLNPGTNSLTLTAVNAAGLTNVVTFNVVQSALILTMNTVTPDYQLWSPTVNVSGTVSNPGCSLTVNGITAVIDGGNWTAANVPVNQGGTASFVVNANDTSGQPAGNLGSNQDKPAEIFVSYYQQDWQYTYVKTLGSGPHPNVVTCPNSYTKTYHLNWTEDLGSGSYYIAPEGTNNSCETDCVWPADEYILNMQPPSQTGTSTSTCDGSQTNIAPPNILLEHCNMATNGADGCGTNRFTRTGGHRADFVDRRQGVVAPAEFVSSQRQRLRD